MRQLPSTEIQSLEKSEGDLKDGYMLEYLKSHYDLQRDTIMDTTIDNQQRRLDSSICNIYAGLPFTLNDCTPPTSKKRDDTV